MRINAQFEAEPAQITSGLSNLISDLRSVITDKDALGTIEIVLAEALNNITEHAYSDRGYGDIKAKLAVKPNHLCVDIVDHGKPMPDLQLPLKKAANLNVETVDLPEGGFGWFMIHELTQDLSYAREANQNRLSFRIPLTDS